MKINAVYMYSHSISNLVIYRMATMDSVLGCLYMNFDFLYRCVS